MSAYVVNRDHIWFLVEAAAGHVLNENNPNAGGLSWYFNGHRHEIPHSFHQRQAEVGQMLWDENVKSVSHRYPDCDGKELPGPIDCDFQYGQHDSKAFARISAVAVLKACDGYEYQSCEHPGWESSEAHSFLESLRHRAIGALPGYDDAQWEVEFKRAHRVA